MVRRIGATLLQRRSNLEQLAGARSVVWVVALAALDVAPIAAVRPGRQRCLILLKVITAEDVSRPAAEVLMLIAGMVVLGIALDERGWPSRAPTS